MSLHARLTRLLLLSIVPLALLIGVGLFGFVRAALLARFDDGLLTRARALSGMVKAESGRLDLDFAGEAMPQFESPGGSEYFQLWELDNGVPDRAPGRVVERSASLATHDLPARLPHAGSLTWNVRLPDLGEVRCVALRFTPQPEDEGSEHDDDSQPQGHEDIHAGELLVVAAQSRRELDRTLDIFAGALGAAAVALAAGVLLAVRLALHRGLAPIADLSDQLSAIGPGDLSARLDAAGAPRELAPIALRANAMLERVAAAFQREKRLAASAAHELRTPIAEIRAVADVAVSRPRSAEEYRHALEVVLAAAEHMSESTGAVLRLHRVQSGLERPEIEDLDLRTALAPAWARWIEPLANRGVQVRFDVPPGLSIKADRAMLHVILDNVCANIAEHTPGDGEVRAEPTKDREGTITLRLTNSLPRPNAPLAPDETRPSTEPRPPDSLHAGLGLRIAEAMTGALNGVFVAETGPDRFVVRVTLLCAGPTEG